MVISTRQSRTAKRLYGKRRRTGKRLVPGQRALPMPADRASSTAACRAVGGHRPASSTRQRELVDQHLAVHHRQAHVGAARGIDERRPRIAVGREVRPIASTTIRSARLPGSIDPISSSSPSARAPSRVAIQTTSRAGSAPGAAAHRLERRREPHLVEHVEPVVAGGAVGAERHRDAARPHLGDRRDAGSELQVRPGAVQDLDVALGEQLLLALGRPRRSARRTAAGVARPVSARYSRFDEAARQPPHDLDLVARSPTRACARACAARAESAATASSSSREHDTAKRGANAARSRPFAAPSQRFWSARLSSIDALRLLAAAAPARRRPRPSCTCRPSRAGRISASVFEHDVGVVHGLHRQHRGRAARAAVRPRRAAPTRAASPACAPPPSARRAAAATRAAACRRRSRETASGRDGRGSG